MFIHRPKLAWIKHHSLPPSKMTMSCYMHTRVPSRHGIKQVGMSQSATPAMQNDMTTCLKTFEKEMFCSFPHRHGEATGKPETRDETRGRSKTTFRARLPLILTLWTRYKTGWNVTKRHACHAKRHDNLLGNLKRRGFAASPIDTARPQENQRLETRHVGASKFRERLPLILILCSFIKTEGFPTIFLRNL